MSNELKPCPFCGEQLLIEEKRSEYIHPNNDCFLAEADSEYGAVWFNIIQEYVDKWNRRVDNA